MKIIRRLLLYAFLLLAVAGSYVSRANGEGDRFLVPIARNIAWNEFVSQIQYLPDDSMEDSLCREALIIQKFLKAHETERKVGIYDLEMFRAIDQARARLQKADKDLETLRNELSYKEGQETLGR
jgi:hypothetical protein